ncbi:MAG: DUF5058 family protein [Clostridia bacterium]|nr:DUF5058 family protein [Clostridia bacterium]MBR6186364.1 DUF5058 family protein [Clostridia bacterium]
MQVMQQLSSPVIYLICGGIVAFVAAVCVVFAVRAWRAGKAIGMDTAVLRRVVTSSASFSVLPAVAILLGVIALSGSLGIPWPWLRLSVIGALHYETQVAQGAAEQVGIHLSGSEMTASAFATIALLMSVCIMWGMILNLFLNKKYTNRLSRNAGKSGPSFGDQAMSAMFIGLVSVYMGSYLGQWISGNGRFAFAGSPLPLLTSLCAAAVMAGLTWIAEKKQLKWLEDFSLAIAMLAGMACAVLLNAVM